MLKVKSIWHVSITDMPAQIRKVVRTIALEDCIPFRSGISMRWVTSAIQVPVSSSDKEYDTAANTLNLFLVQVSGFDSDAIVYIDF